jgi:hypothetical protein
LSSLSTIRAAVKSTLETAIQSLRVYDTVPEAVELPAVVVQPTNADFDVAMGRGTDTWTLELLVLVSWGDSDLAQNALDDYISGAGDSSIREAIFNNRGLGLTDCDAHVRDLTSYGVRFQAAQIDHVGAVLTMTVHTRGTA